MAFILFLVILLLVIGLGGAISKQVQKVSSDDTILDSGLIDSQNQDALRKRQMPYGPVAFGADFQWIVVKAEYRERVAVALGISSIEMVNWQYGLHKAKENNIFITPSIEGWIFAAGWGLGEVREKSELMEKLSRDFGEAQYFHSHEGSESHTWIRYVNGEMIRHFTCVEGDILTNEGTIATAESEFDYTQTLPDKILLFNIASEWSLSPTQLDAAEYESIEGLGTLGYLQP